jgi:hypothetical protein
MLLSYQNTFPAHALSSELTRISSQIEHCTVTAGADGSVSDIQIVNSSVAEVNAFGSRLRD